MQSFDTGQLFFKYRHPLLILLVGAVLISGGLFFLKSGISSGTKIEILDDGLSETSGKFISVEVAGEVVTPGVYKVPLGSRVEDALILSGGFSGGADRDWTEKYLNRAAKLSDGQKIYIPGVSEQSVAPGAKNGGQYQSTSASFSSDSKVPININSASLGELDALPGIGPVYGQSIIDHRPYSNVEELLSKGALKKNVYEKIKDLVSIY